MVDEEDFLWLKAIGDWTIDKGGYPSLWRRIRIHTILSKRYFKKNKNKIIDHINGNKLDNRKINLRQTTYSNNLLNKKIGIKNKSGYLGVSWSKASKKWLSRLKINYKEVYSQFFDKKIDAAIAYDIAKDFFVIFLFKKILNPYRKKKEIKS